MAEAIVRSVRFGRAGRDAGLRGRRSVFAIAAAMTAVIAGCRSAPSEQERIKSASPRPSRTVSAADARVDPADPEAPVPRMRVNGQIVEASEVLRPYLKELTEGARTMSPSAYQALVKETTIRAVQQRISEVLLYGAASARLTEDDEKMLDKVVDAELRRRVTEFGGGVQGVYEERLRDRGTTLIAEREAIRRQVVIQRHLQMYVYPKIQPATRDELLALYEQVRPEFVRPERRKLELIEIDVLRRIPGNATAPTREQQAEALAAAKAAMNDVRQALAEGQSFLQVAQERSEGLNAENGGDWGWVARDTLRARWQKAVDVLFSLEEGGVSDVIETPEALFLVRCGGIEAATDADFQSLQPELIRRHENAQADRLIREVLADLQARARIEPERIDRFLLAVALTAPPHTAAP